MMAQWHACKEVAGDATLLFRMGDFYEAFYQDAVLLSKVLNLTLTKRQGIPMAGVPWQSGASYIDRLVSKGHRVAIAEQMEDPSQAKGLVKREVVRFVTPGTMLDVPDKDNNFFAAIAQIGKVLGLAIIDLTTAEFRVCEFESEEELISELYRLRPKEFLTSKSELLNDLKHVYDFLVNEREEWQFDHEMAIRFLARHFNVHSLDGFGLKGMPAAIKAAGALLTYLNDDLRLSIGHIRQISPYSTDYFLAIDQMTQRNLELTESLRDGSRKGTLLEILDETETPMGGRLLRRWIKQPLLSVEKIGKRQEEIARLVDDPRISRELSDHLGTIRDLERLMMKIYSKVASPRDFTSLRFSLEQLPKIAPLIELPLEDLSDVTEKIAKAIVDDPPMRLSDGGAFRKGFDAKLDELSTLSSGNKSWLADYQMALRNQTGIKTLKVGYNRVFGYYIEVGKASSDRVPETFHRRQTLTNSERFIDPELKEYESKVLSAEEQISKLEQELFATLTEEISQANERVLEAARVIAKVDCLCSLALVAKKRGYTKPTIDESDRLIIEEGRHPVIEAGPSHFIPNDAMLDCEKNQMLIITGPNMAGKSTYIRQVALITLMAQIGSFVPAKSAHVGIVDKIFTRIGASDDLARGQSTFMVEMTETANILNNATSRSLVILDEIGRGTSTYDGVSIAWAVAEYLLNLKAKTLFATHYLELTELEGAVNYNVAVQENQGDILFLHKIIPGGGDKSYGIHVARLAGLPLEVIERAHTILSHLESGETKKPPKKNPSEVQLTLF